MTLAAQEHLSRIAFAVELVGERHAETGTRRQAQRRVTKLVRRLVTIQGGEHRRVRRVLAQRMYALPGAQQRRAGEPRLCVCEHCRQAFLLQPVPQRAR
jgi:hypothetical protein